MTHATTSTPLPRRATRARALILASAVAISAFVVGPTRAGAVPRTESVAIAIAAASTVDALESWDSTSNPADYVRFVQGRGRTATLTAIDLEVDPSTLRLEWANVGVEKQHVLLAAMTQLGVPYRSLKSAEGIGFDCSGLLIWAFAEAGVTIPRVSRDQIRAANPADRSMVEAGDLVYYPGHIGLYLGSDSMIHSPETGRLIEARQLPDKRLTFGDAVQAALEIAQPNVLLASGTGLLVDWPSPIS
jgi:cell wall-associated NlpC family hydrolase